MLGAGVCMCVPMYVMNNEVNLCQLGVMETDWRSKREGDGGKLFLGSLSAHRVALECLI
jgi:hypothetical protein